MLKFFGISSINWTRLIAVGMLLSIVTGTIYAGYRTINNILSEREALIEENAILRANEQQYLQSIQEQQDTIESLEEDVDLANQIRETVNQDFLVARNQVEDLQERLSRHELGFLALQRSGLVENIVNNASDNVARCFEIATGAPLTQDEINATKPSEINTECPEIANPNYQSSQ